ncbi:unnamed protein product [Cyclocybe aegerita]|uniref:F-box domain-containing protein n=1 Tax=Cyclocybe aegerita TaxID=1973307 RepID=A0A8S0VVK3_CYCAE|nr:unnamed protein product [Cyclocybe aegerita]
MHHLSQLIRIQSHNAWNNILSGIRTGIGLPMVTPDENAIRNSVQNTLQNEIRKLRKGCGSKLAKIKALCGEIVALEETIADRERQLGILSSVSAPIRRLPTELLTRIFRFTLPSGNIQPAIFKSPLALCGVSKLWRDAVVNDPQMWSQIWCHFPTCESAPSKEYDKILQRIECFSCRSGTTALTIEIFENSSITFDNRARIAKQLETLYPRCRALKFEIKGAWEHSILQDIPLNAFSSLESLYLDRAGNPNTSEIQLFSNSPLRHYGLYLFTALDLINISIPHHRLETLDLIMSVSGDNSLRDTVQSWRSYMYLCCNLRAANIEVDVWQRWGAKFDDGMIWDFPSVPTPTTSLTQLTLKIGCDANVSTLLRGMDFPALELLHLGCKGFVTAAEVSLVPEGADLADTVERDMPYIRKLTTLCLSGLKIRKEDLRTLLCLTQCLERLCVFEMWEEAVQESPDLVSFLSMDEHESEEGFSPPLPRLRVLALYSGPRPRLLAKSKPMPHSAYANLARSRYMWIKESRMTAGSESATESGDQAGSTSLPFKFVFTVQNDKDTKDYYKTIKESMEDAFQDLPCGVLQVNCASNLHRNAPLPEGF